MVLFGVIFVFMIVVMVVSLIVFFCEKCVEKRLVFSE